MRRGMREGDEGWRWRGVGQGERVQCLVRAEQSLQWLDTVAISTELFPNDTFETDHTCKVGFNGSLDCHASTY